MKNPDEDYAYGQWKQRQIDESPTKVPQFAKDYGVQKYANFDPHPDMPFEHPREPIMTLGEAILYGFGWGFAILALVISEFLK